MAIFLEVGKWTNSCCYSVWTCSRMQMKVLICPVILGYTLPWRPWNIWRKLSRIVARWVMWEGWGGGGSCPEGIFSWELLPECNVTLMATWCCGNPEGCGTADSTRLSDSCRRVSLMAAGISGWLLYLKGGGCWYGLSFHKFDTFLWVKLLEVNL